MRRFLIALGAGAALTALSGMAAQATTGGTAGGLPPPSNGVLAKPVRGTPHFSVTNANPIEQVRQLVQCGGTMYAVGSFSQIVHRGAVRGRHNVFSFSATSPFKLTKWSPKVNGA